MTKQSACRKTASRPAPAGQTFRKTGNALTAASPKPISKWCNSKFAYKFDYKFDPQAFMKPIIIVGAGMAAYTIARELRKLDKAIPLLIITADNGGFYSKPMLSNAFAQKKLAAQLITQSAVQMAEQ